MFRMALALLVAAMVAAVFGFGLFADVRLGEARVLFVVFLALAVVGFIADAFRAPLAEPA